MVEMTLQADAKVPEGLSLRWVSVIYEINCFLLIQNGILKIGQVSKTLKMGLLGNTKV